MEKAIQLIIFECEKHIANKLGSTEIGVLKSEIEGNPYTMPGELLKLFNIKMEDIIPK